LIRDPKGSEIRLEILSGFLFGFNIYLK